MLEGKYFRNVDMGMPFLCCVLEICLQLGHDAPLKTIQVAYNELLSTALKKSNGISTREVSERTAAILSEQVLVLKECVYRSCSQNQTPLTKSLKYHLLHRASFDICTFGSLVAVGAGLYEYSNIIVKNMYRVSSKRRETSMDETVKRHSAEISRIVYKDVQGSMENYGDIVIGVPQAPRRVIWGEGRPEISEVESIVHFHGGH